MKLIFLAVLTLTLSLPASAQLRKWNQKMQELKSTFSEILPLVSSQTKLSPKELKKLEDATEKLTTLAHSINMSPDTGANPLPPESDPTLQYLSGLFDRQLKYANRSLKAGQVAYARRVLSKTAGYCIACHTRHDKGPDFPFFELEPNLKALSLVERAELLAATRQFDKALDEFEKAAADKTLSKSRPFEWERAVRQGVNLAVRVKTDPARTSKLIEKALTVEEAPQFFRRELQAWKESVGIWKTEAAKEAKTEDELFEQAVYLNGAARVKQTYPLDHAGDIYYLRASAAVHKLLSANPQGKHAAEALLLAGNAYRLLGEPIVTPLPELYFEACVRQSPHSQVARLCYERYEESIYFGYSGSGGTFIPENLQENMKELKTLAAEK